MRKTGCLKAIIYFYSNAVRGIFSIRVTPASRSLYFYQLRVWLHRTLRLPAAQTLKPMCRLKPTRRMRAVHTHFAVQTIVLKLVSKHHLLLYLEKMPSVSKRASDGIFYPAVYYPIRLNTKSQTPCPRRLPRASNLVSGR